MEETLKTLFLAGRHAEVMNRALLDEKARFAPDETPLVVASLAALGQIGDAELLLRHHLDLLDDEALIFGHTHLAIAAASTGRYATARRHLGSAAALRDNTSDPESHFLLYHGLAHYRYATGRLAAALMSSHRAQEFLRRSHKDYPQLLGHEQSGHLKATTGDVRSAPAHFATAIQVAERLSRTGHAHQLNTVVSLYEARYALKPKAAVQRLRLASGQLHDSDVLPKVAIHLEMCRQELLRNKVDNARAALEQAAKGLVGVSSRRYEATANLRLIDVALATGAFAEAMLMILTAERTLDAEGDDLLAYEFATRRVAALTKLVANGSARILQTLQDARTRLSWLARRTGFQAPVNPKAKPKAQDPGLNHRQLALLSELGDRDFIDVQTYRSRNDISEITASRDLSQLARFGHLQRVGKARATRYGRYKTPLTDLGANS